MDNNPKFDKAVNEIKAAFAPYNCEVSTVSDSDIAVARINVYDKDYHLPASIFDKARQMNLELHGITMHSKDRIGMYATFSTFVSAEVAEPDFDWLSEVDRGR